MLESSYVSQTTVDNAVQAINNAIENRLLKGDITELQKLIDNALTDENNYTTSTWLVYHKAINAVKNAIQNVDNISENDVSVLIDNVNLARDSLVFNHPIKKKLLLQLKVKMILLLQLEKPEDIYTSASWQNYADAKRT